MSTEQLTPTSYLVLGLLAREGPSTPYALKRPRRGHARPLLVVPALAPLRGARPSGGSRAAPRAAGGGRTTAAHLHLTAAGQAALQAWLSRPSHEPTELRDPGLLQLFFADLGPPEARLAIAAEQLEAHRAKLADYEEDQRLERGPGAGGPGQRTAERWHGETVRMGLLYERAAVDFWAGVTGSAGGADGAGARGRAEDDGARVTW